MTRSILVASALGAGLGFVVPLPWGGADGSESRSQPQQKPEGEDSSANASPSRPTPTLDPQALCQQSAAARRANLDEIEAFRVEWGSPPQVPPGWDPDAEEARLRDLMNAVPSELSAVNCEIYPCVVALVYPEKRSKEELATTFGVSPQAINASMAWDVRELQTTAVAMIDTEKLNTDELKFVRRLGARLLTELGPDIDRLLAQPAP